MLRDVPRPEPRNPHDDRPRRSVGASARRAGLIFMTAVLAMAGPSSSAVAQPGGLLKEVGFDQNLDTQIPLTLSFKDGEGKDVHLADYFGKRPVILVMGYSNCPMLCSNVLGELTRSLKIIDLSVGKDFDVVTVSINPKETPEVADSMRRNYLKRYKRPDAEAGWHALTGDEASIRQLAKAIGFRYAYNPVTGVYAHASGFVLLTPAGKIARYFYGVEYPADELKYALMDTSVSRISKPIDRLLLYCYDYDPATGKYTFAIMNAIKVLGIATALALGSYMFAMIRRDRRMARATKPAFFELPPGPSDN